MSLARRTLAVAALLLSLALLPDRVTAQDHAMAEGDDGASTFGEDFPHGVTFWTRREPVGCWLCAPAIDVNFGLYQMSAEPDDISELFLRLHSQFGLGVRHIALSADLLWIPEISQSRPTFSLVAQYEPFDQRKRVYGSIGAGMISERDQNGNGFTPWAQAQLAYRSPIHDIAPFVQAGRALSGDDREFEFMLGIAHPIAPYRMH